MSVYWDFRSILDVYPDESGFTCVGITQKGARCRQWMFSGRDLSCASGILDEMGAHKRLSSSYKYLEELAELTLCPRWHRKPGYSQVRSVTMQWKSKIAKHAAEIEREQQLATKIESKRALAEIRNNLVRIRMDLEEDANKDKVPVAISLATAVKTESSLSTTVVKVEARTPTATATPIPKASVADITPPPSLNNTPSRVLGSKEQRSDSKASSDLPLPKCSLPSPPASSLNSNLLSSNEIKAEQYPPATPTKTSSRQGFTITKTSSIKVTATAESNEVIPTTISQEKTKIQTFNFELPPTPDATPQPHNKQESTGCLAYEFGAGKQVPLPTFDLGITAKLPTSLPVADGYKHVDTNNGVHRFNFNPEYKVPSTSFDFSTPIKFPSSVEDPFVSSSDGLSKKSSTPVKTAPIHTNIGVVSPEATPEPTQSKFHEPEESYGYAIVTPSTPYKSYLPSQHRYGLATPPETPESRRDGFQDPFLAFISDSPSSVIAILSKPLPNPPTSGVRDGDAETCEACGAGEDHCACGENSGEENERVGCFHSLRLRKLRKRVVRKINAVKTRISGTIHLQSSSPKRG